MQDDQHTDDQPDTFADDLANELAFTPWRLYTLALLGLAIYGGLVSIFD